MGQISWRLTQKKSLRERVNARRAREERVDAVRRERRIGYASPGVLRQARHKRFGLTRLGRKLWGRGYTLMGDYEFQMPEKLRESLHFDLRRRLLAPWSLPLVLFVVLMTAFGILLYGFTHPVEKVSAASGKAKGTPTTAPLAVLDKTAKPTRILLLGSDRREKEGIYRTDVVMLVTISPKNEEVSVVSFPRDLILKQPGYGDDRINTAMARGGFKMMQETFQNNLSVRPEYYFMINFEGFVGMVNSIGGITVNAEQPLEDACDLPQQRKGKCSIKPGKHEMDGATALWYIRSRHSSNDFDRLRRAQEVMTALFQKFVKTNAITRLPELYKQYNQDVETNMSLPKMAGLLPVAARVMQDSKRLHKYAVTPEMTGDWITNEGAAVLLGDLKSIREMVHEASFEEEEK